MYMGCCLSRKADKRPVLDASLLWPTDPIGTSEERGQPYSVRYSFDGEGVDSV